MGWAYTTVAQPKNAVEKQQIVDAVGDQYNRGAVQTFNERYEGVKGTPYLFDQWTNGEVEMRSSQVFDNVRIKYNVYLDELLVKRRDGAEVVPDKSTVVQFVLNSGAADPRRFVRIDYLTNYRKFPYNHFAEMLYEGASTLLAVRRKKLIKADYRRAYHANRPYDEFGETMTTYYLITPDGQVGTLRSHRKSILRRLKDQRDAVDKFIEDQAIDFANPDDLVRLVRYYDGLVGT